MNDQSKVIDQDGAEVVDPRKVMQEQTLAVDLARVELDHSIATAHKFPRIIDTVMKKISTLACYNKDSAENCVYALPRGGKPIIGPSIGFANIVAQAWGNCRVGARITFIDKQQKVVIAEGAFLDLETNTQSIVPVQRRIVDSKGRLYSDDMQIVTGMAAASIARRNAILQGVSRGLWHPIWMDALGIVRGDVTTFAENKAAAFKALAQFGVKPEQIIMLLGLKGEVDLTFEHIPTIRGMYVALRDGSMTVEELLDPRRMTGRGFATVDDPLGAQPEDLTAGMGEDAAQTSAQQAGTAAQPTEAAAGDAKPKAAAKQQAPAKDELPLDSGAQGAAKTEAKPEPKPEAKPEPKLPANAAEYVEHWRAFCAGATSAGQVKNQYSAERQLRKNCEPIDSEQHDEITQIKDERIAQLGAK
jgi:hypothetical protein